MVFLVYLCLNVWTGGSYCLQLSVTFCASLSALASTHKMLCKPLLLSTVKSPNISIANANMFVRASKDQIFMPEINSGFNKEHASLQTKNKKYFPFLGFQIKSIRFLKQGKKQTCEDVFGQFGLFGFGPYA